ncbi:MAG TPA: hypothetical protein VNG89_14485 [Vicinamibacterales bacterium]|nr:hypothetical protein [Vicinamibacterales bacterium]
MSIRLASCAAIVLLPSLAAAQQGGAAPPPAGRGGAPAAYPPYTRPTSSYVPPKTPDGQPDISGLYLAIPLPRNIETPTVPLAGRGANRANSEFSYSLNERPKLPEGAIARPAGVDPPDGRIPLTPAALARRKDIIANQEKVERLDGRVLCLAPGIPRSTVPAPVVGYQIFQKPGAVVIFYEQSHLYRTIPLDGRAPLDPNIRKAMGVSRGHWEGNVLVVEVTNFTTNFENNWVIGAISATPGVPAESLATGHGIPHSDRYRVTERYTPIDANTIHYEAKITDEEVFTQPWTVAWYGFARAPKDYVPVEYACFEGNEKNLLLMTNTDISGIRVNVP